MLTLLDLSAAFDCIDHHTLLQRLRTSYIYMRRSSTGLRRTSAAEHNKFAQRRPVRCHRHSILESRKVIRSLDRSCFCSTLPTCCSSSKVIISRHTRMQTTPRSMDTVSRPTLSVLLSGSYLRRDFSVDEGKSTAAESRQDRGPLVRLIST